MDKDHADDGKICQGKAKDHGPFTAHAVGKQAHGNAQQERRKRRSGVNQAEELATVAGIDNEEVEEQIPAAEEQAVEEKRQQEQPGGFVQAAELIEDGTEKGFHKHPEMDLF